MKCFVTLKIFLYKLVFRDFCVLIDDTKQALWKCIYHENDLIDEKFHLNH